MGKFTEALNRTAEEIKRPPPPPLGLYIMRIVKMPDPAVTIKGKQGNEFEKISIPIETVSAYEVEEETLAEYPGKIAGIRLKMDVLFDQEDEAKFEASLNRLKEFLEKCGVDVTTGNLSQWLSESPNCQFIGEITHRVDPDDDAIIYAELGRRTAPLE